MDAKRLVGPWVLAIALLVATFATPAAMAGEPVNAWVPGFTADESAPVMSTELPWVETKDLLFKQDHSVFWNSFYRVGKGQIQLNGLEYIRYDYNNKTDRVDSGIIKEVHHTVRLSGVPISNLRLFAGAGISTVSIDLGDDSVKQLVNRSGLVFDLGFDVGLPIGDIATIIGRGWWRQWNVSRANGTSTDTTYAQEWHAELLVALELFGDRNEFTMNVYAGGSWQYIIQRWEFSGTIEAITPDNNALQGNGPGRYVVIAGVNALFNEYFSAHAEARFVGPLQFLVGVTVIL